MSVSLCDSLSSFVDAIMIFFVSYIMISFCNRLWQKNHLINIFSLQLCVLVLLTELF